MANSFIRMNVSLKSACWGSRSSDLVRSAACCAASGLNCSVLGLVEAGVQAGQGAAGERPGAGVVAALVLQTQKGIGAVAFCLIYLWMVRSGRRGAAQQPGFPSCYLRPVVCCVKPKS